MTWSDCAKSRPQHRGHEIMGARQRLQSCEITTVASTVAQQCSNQQEDRHCPAILFGLFSQIMPLFVERCRLLFRVYLCSLVGLVPCGMEALPEFWRCDLDDLAARLEALDELLVEEAFICRKLPGTTWYDRMMLLLLLLCQLLWLPLPLLPRSQVL